MRRSTSLLCFCARSSTFCTTAGFIPPGLPCRITPVHGNAPTRIGDAWAVLFSCLKDFVIGRDKKVKLVLVYPMSTGRNFGEVLRVVDSLQLTATHKVSTPMNWEQGDELNEPAGVGLRLG
jgi:hypothetical protein